MRIKIAVVLSTLMMVVLLVPTGAWARRVTATGSLSLTLTPAGVLTNQLVVTAVTANPGLEKIIVQELPRTGGTFVLPFFVGTDTVSPLPGDLDTILFITNVTGTVQTPVVTLRSLSGSVLATATLPALAPDETRIVRLSDLLP